MTTFWYCERCRNAHVESARRKMAADHVDAKTHATLVKAIRDYTGGFAPKKCQHAAHARQVCLLPSLRVLLLNEQPKRAPSKPRDPDDWIAAMRGRAAELDKVAAKPFHRDYAQQYDAQAADRDVRETQRIRANARVASEQREKYQSEKARKIRVSQKTLGFIEMKLDPGPPMTYRDYEDFVMYKVPELSFERCKNYGRNAIRAGVEVMCFKRRPGDIASRVLWYAERVHRGLVRNWVTPEVAAQSPHLVVKEDPTEDAYLNFDDGEINDFEPYDGGPSEKWQAKQQSSQSKYSAARKARGLDKEKQDG